MCTNWTRILLRFSLLGMALLALACAGAQPAATAPPASQPLGQEAQTASYRMQVLIGPVQSAMGLPMTMTDQGHAVNRHLQIHISSKATGAAVKGANPRVTLTEKTTGAIRQFTSVRECVPPNDHGAGPHYGDNLYLPNGTYAVTVSVGEEPALFEISL